MNVSLLHTTVRVNGHTCEGWAAAANALELPDIQVANHEVGPDGLKVVSSTGMRGGMVTYRFQANSRTRAFFGDLFTQILQGRAVEWEMSISNSQTGESTRAERGHVEVGAAGTTLGNGTPPAREFQIHYESVLTSYDGFKADAAPVSID